METVSLASHLSEVEKEAGVLSGLRQVGEKHHGTQSQQPSVSGSLAQGLVGGERKGVESKYEQACSGQQIHVAFSLSFAEKLQICLEILDTWTLP